MTVTHIMEEDGVHIRHTKHDPRAALRSDEPSKLPCALVNRNLILLTHCWVAFSHNYNFTAKLNII